MTFQARDYGARTLRVAYFSNQFATADGHGVARYAHELFDALNTYSEHDILPVAAWSSLDPEAKARLVSRTGLKFTGLGRRATPLAWSYLKRPLLEGLIAPKPDVFHAVSLGYPIATRLPLAITVHDLGHITHPQFFSDSRTWVMEKSLSQLDRQADAVICVSQSTANEVIDRLGPAIEDRIRVVYEGVAPRFFDPPASECLDGLPLPDPGTPFILSAGKISPRKNIAGVLKAFLPLLDEIPHHLVLAGGIGWDADDVVTELRDPKLRSRTHMVGYVNDDQLRALYGQAAMYVHPSLYEGFGLTILEAMAAGTPVITSNTTSLPEVAGDGAVLVDPTRDDELADAILKLATDPNISTEYKKRGKARASEFKWSNCARQVAEIYDEIA